MVSRASPGSTSTAPNSRISASGVLGEAGGLEVDEGERTQRRRECGERVGVDPDLARKRLSTVSGAELPVNFARLRCALRLHFARLRLAARFAY